MSPQPSSWFYARTGKRCFDLAIAVRGDNVAMQVAVLNRGQRDQLQRSLDALRDSLEEDGLSVVDMRVLDISGGAGQQQAAG